MSEARFAQWDAQSAAALIAPIAASAPGPVLLCLQAVQNQFGYVPAEATSLIADACNVTRADVHGVLTYYADLRTQAPPAIPVRLCAAEACQAVGGRALKAEWQKACQADPALAAITGTDEAVFCLGNCALGPAAMVDGELIGCADVTRLRDAVARAQGERA